MREVVSVLPGTAGTTDWRNLTERANELPMPGTPRAVDDLQVLTHAESENVARVVAEGGHRLYPGEQELVPFMQSITRPVDASRLRDLGPGEVPIVPLPVRAQAQAVPTASIAESELRTFAKRLAETRPGSEDGNTDDVRLTDLSADPSSMTAHEIELCDRIRNRYFAVTYSPASAIVDFKVPLFASSDGQVTAAVHRTNKMTFVDSRQPFVTDSVESTHIEIAVPHGAKLVSNYDGFSTVHSQPKTASPTADVYALSASPGTVVCIKVVAATKDGEPGVPRLIAVFGARMPVGATTRRELSA